MNVALGPRGCGNLAPRVADRGISGTAALQVGLGRGEPPGEGGVAQRLDLTDEDLEAVLDSKQRFLAFSLALGAFAHRSDHPPAQLGQGRHPDRQRDLTLEGELLAREQALGRSRIADYEHGLAIDRCTRVPLEMRRRGDRLAVLVSAQKACIHRVAREVEIVGIATELRGLRFRRPGQPDVAIFAIGVELVLAPAVEADDLAAGGGGVGAAGAFQRGGGGGAGANRLGPGERADRLLHPRGHVADRGHHLGLLPGALLLLRSGARGEALGEDIVGRGRIFLDAGRDAMMIGEDQPGIRDEAGRAAAGQPHCGGLRLVQPGLVGGPAISRAHPLRREGVEGPHALVGAGGGKRQGQSGREQDGTESVVHRKFSSRDARSLASIQLGEQGRGGVDDPQRLIERGGAYPDRARHPAVIGIVVSKPGHVAVEIGSDDAAFAVDHRRA